MQTTLGNWMQRARVSLGSVTARKSGPKVTGSSSSDPTKKAEALELIRSTPVDSVNRRVQALLEKMTLEEKALQMAQYAWGGAVTGPQGAGDEKTESMVREGIGSLFNVVSTEDVNRLQRIAREESPMVRDGRLPKGQGIPLLLARDVIYGDTTIGPVPLAMASSFDPSVPESVGEMAGRETKARGVPWTFAPMMDVSRDPRWGRVVEGWGVDTRLTSVMALANMRGFKKAGVMTTAKHFVGYGAPDGGRDYNATWIPDRLLHERHLPPFEEAVKSGVDAVMPGFNALNGIPATVNEDLLGRLDDWGFHGIVVTDYTAILEAVHHRVAEDRADAGVKAANAGVHMDMESDIFAQHLAEAVRAGDVSEAKLDEAVRRILRAKVELGLFENPYVDPEVVTQTILSPEHEATALRAAEKSIVLLKNDPLDDGRPILPLAQDARKIAVVGPLADSQLDVLGQWRANGDPKDATSVLDGIRAAAGEDQEVLYAAGSAVNGRSPKALKNAVRAAEQADVVVAVIGESEDMSGEATSRTDPRLPEAQLELLKRLQRTGKPVVAVLVNGRPLTGLEWIAKNVPAVLESWQLGTMHGEAVANVLFGKVSPGGKLPVDYPAEIGQTGGIDYDRPPTGRPPEREGADPKYVSRYARFDRAGKLIRDDPADFQNEGLWVFGHGLSYTTFDLSNVSAPERVRRTRLESGSKIPVRVTVTNTGESEGDEVVQLYVRDVAASEAPFGKQLADFERVTLKSGESRTVELSLSAKDLSFFSERKKRWVLEPGRFEIFVGSSSKEGVTKALEVVEQKRPFSRPAS